MIHIACVIWITRARFATHTFVSAFEIWRNRGGRLRLWSARVVRRCARAERLICGMKRAAKVDLATGRGAEREFGRKIKGSRVEMCAGCMAVIVWVSAFMLDFEFSSRPTYTLVFFNLLRILVFVQCCLVKIQFVDINAG